MIVDGRALAAEVLARVRMRAEALGRRPNVLAYVAPHETAATHSYLKIKARSAEAAGCDFEETRSLSFSSQADTIIVQLPLPPEVDTTEVLNSIPVEKDADVLSTVARMKFEADEDNALIPPVASAVKKILEFGGVDPRGKKAVVVGAGWLVGKPCATWLSHAGADVSHFTLTEGHTDMLKDADIIVSGAGSPHFIKPEMIKKGVALIDAGTSESGGALMGDVDPACADKCSIFTPVPGGVGPLAVACLFENTVALAERAAGIYK